MHKSWNYQQRLGGAESLGSNSSGGYYEKRPVPKSCSKHGYHKWMTKRYTRTCRICGFHQDLVATVGSKKIYEPEIKREK